jgi:formate dehydrogenase subunit gamma
MNSRVLAFSRLQIWFHKHVIHFMVLFVATGLPILSPKFSWLAWVYGLPLSAAFGVESRAEIVALGVQAARAVHWAGACFFSVTVVAFALAMLPSWRRWQVWPERVGLAALKDGATELRHRYLTYTPANVGKYNMGQKALIWLMIVGVAAMMASGLVLMLRADVSLEWAGFARFVHVLFFVLITVTLILHVYLATHPINRAGLHAMFGSGEIDAEVVRRNHPLWWKKLTSK